MSYPPVLPLPLYLPNLPRETLPVRFEEHFDTQGSTRAQELLTELTLKRKRLNTYLLVNPSVESRKNVETLCNDYLSLLAGMVADPSSFSSSSSPAPPSPSIPSPYAPSPNASSSSNPYATVAAAAAAAASAPPPSNSAASSPSVSGNSALPLSRACAFTWTNFSIAGNPISYGGAGFEICSTLLNLGLWYLSIGKELAISEDPTVRDGNQRSAFEYFAMAAGVFDNLLKHSTVKTPGENSDLKQEVYEALSNVALAESQSITITRNESRSNPLLIASLCHDTYEKYSVATTLLCTANPNPHSKFVTFLQFKANFFLSKAYFYHGIHLRGSESLSRGLKSLETARLTLKEARRLFDTFLAEKPSSKGLEASEYLDEVKSDMWSEYHRTELELERERGAERLPSQADPLPEPTSKVSPVKFTSPAINSRFWNLEVYLSLKPHRDAVSAARIGEFNPLLEEPRSGCFPFRKAPCAKKTVVIAGGGIAGMTVAHELLEKGYDVTIFEAGATLGGKAGCEEYNSNLIRDHSIKNFSSYYYCMLETMKRIPFQDSEETKAKEKSKGKGKKGEKKQKERKSVFDNLTPYDHLSCVFSDGSSLDVDTSLDQGILATLQTFKELREKFSKEGTPVSKIDSFVLKHISLIFMCDQRKRKKLDNISYEEFLGVNFEERPDIKKLYNLVQVTAAAKPEGSALAAADQALKMYGKLYNPHKLKKTGNILNGTIQEKFIGPWQTHIQKLGGRVFTSRPVDKVLVSEHDNKKIDGFVLADGSIVKADHYVLAVPISKLKFIINNSGLTQRLTPAIPALTTVAGEKWGHSCHFALKSLPFGVTPTIVHAAVESPWSVVFYYITRDLWKTDPHLTDEAPVQLWITCSDAITPGVLFNKPYSQCTEKEFMEELLKQANFKDEDRHLIVDAVVGKGLNWWDLKNSRSYPGKVAPSDLPPTPIPTPESQPANSAPIYPTLGSTPAFSSSGSFRPIPQSSQTPSSSFESTRSSADQLYPKKAAPLTKEEKGKSKMEEIQEVHEDHGDGNKKEGCPNRVSYMDLTEQFLKNGPALRGQRVNEVNPSLQIVCDDPLYARDVGQAEFDNKTDFDNLFIAGECTRTIQLISTMEKANESGKRCAYHICSADGKSYPTKKFEYHPLPLRFIRYIDAFFFHIFG